LAIYIVGEESASSERVLIGMLIVGIFVYFLPTMIARTRKKRNKTPIFVLNLFLGWTVLGWIIALIWAFTVDDVKVT